ncbi:MAG: carbon monoxide dehydrogenase [Halobacteriales archaeon SW_8_66_22]|nr:MAG: carbon monoxide dehydrogenase [Halobacteriales archaeon SW_8_66_22]
MTEEMHRPEEFRPSDLVGTSIQRREDPHLVSGDAEYTDDIQHDGLFLAFVRSRYGHARIEDADASAAEAMAGVEAVYTAADVAASGVPADIRTGGDDAPHHPLLADGRVTFEGQPIAAVLAADRYTAHDAADAIEVSYDRLPAVVGPEAALDEDAPTIHEDVPDNVAFEWETGDEAAAQAALADADAVVDVEFTINRVVPTAMEPRSAVAIPDGDRLSVTLSVQNPHQMREDVSALLGLPEDRIDVRSPDVGGGFGGKLQPYPGYLATAWAAHVSGHPVKWTATRTEEFQSMVHSREHAVSAEVAVSEDGEIHGLRAGTVAPVGGLLVSGGDIVPKNLGLMGNGQYDVPGAYVHVTGAFTNTTPLSAYRGAGRPEATYFTERLIRTVAAELDLDPVELRRRNQLRPEQFPFQTGLGRTYDSGDYERTMDVALAKIGYDEFRERQERLREEGRYVGIGVSAYVEACGVGPGIEEFGGVEVRPSGEVLVRSGTAEIGTGHATGYAQIVARELGVPFEDVEVRLGDTAETGEGTGTFGSRAMAVGGSALKEGAEAVREKAREIAAHHLEAAPEDVAFEDGEFAIRGAPDRSLSMAEVAELAADPGDLPANIDPGLDATASYDPPNYTFPFGTHVATVEVDPDTGEIDIRRYVAVDDVGTQINPTIVKGQVHGGIAQGLGQALYEAAEYDDTGTLVGGSLQDYAVPRAHHMPEIEWDSTVTESPHNPLGVKGVGEAGAIAAPPAIVNAVVDALQPFGVDSLEMPLTQERVWRAVRDSREG